MLLQLSLVNDVFSALLRKCVLVFFDDILVYSESLEEHATQLKMVLGLMREHKLYAKQSKYAFCQPQVEYLGHNISKEGVKIDPSKISAMQQWPKPMNIKSSRGFLGLTGYYRKFVHHYGAISKPLTEMLKKNNFCWTVATEKAFVQLKQAMTQAPVLSLPDFTKPFILETDACDRGMGAVLMQEGRPLAYLSKAFGLKHISLSTYEKEFLAILMAVSRWRHYLKNTSFVIKTDHEALKFLLEQNITSQLQQNYLV